MASVKYIIQNIRTYLDEEEAAFLKCVSKKLHIRESDIISIKVIKQSVDARQKEKISFISTVLAEIKNHAEDKISSRISGGSLPKDIKKYCDDKKEDFYQDIQDIKENSYQNENKIKRPVGKRPVVIGMGPAGLFAALILAENGYRPIVIDRGECIDKRVKTVGKYWETGELDEESNVQFGEGGAGTFSDGKLNTRINDPLCDMVLNTFYKFGAPEEILYKAKPHIGTDKLRNVITNMTKHIKDLGADILFNTKATSLVVTSSSAFVKPQDNKIEGVVINGKTEIESDTVILAIGHSARDTFRMLLELGVEFEQKPFSIGVRIEHLQKDIDAAQYGCSAEHPRLQAADYQLFHKWPDRTAYTFCMCPGGIVVASASEKNTIVTNGMSFYKRDGTNANSALVVSVGPDDFPAEPLAGVDFQRIWERKAFEIAGKGAAPVQLLEDFLEGRVSTEFGRIHPSYTGEFKFADINECLPEFVSDAIKKAVPIFDRKIKGFAVRDAVLTGVETRTSSPVRILRNENFESVSVKGLYPAGEGAGYAGGIMSAAVDGIKAAEAIQNFIPTYVI